MKKTITLSCENCSKQFDRDLYEATRRKKAGKRIFCSQVCASKIRTRESMLDVSCKECGVEFKRLKSSVGENVFCSQSCANTNTNKKMIGSNSRNYTYGESSYRSYARRFKGNSCEICGFDKEYAIEVHHIDKNRKNNNIENLKVLCANCHLGVHRGKIKINN